MEYTNVHGIHFNSRIKFYKSPQGALEAGTKVTFRIRADEHFSNGHAILVTKCHGRERMLYMKRRHGRENEIVFEGVFELPDALGLMCYYFILNDGERLYYLGNNERSAGGSGLTYDEDSPPTYQLTIYEPGFETPEWFRRGVAYQIFPDRFYMGDKKRFEQGVSYHRNLGRKLTVHEDWNEPPLYEPMEGDENYTPTDFYGGNLRGIEEKLPYLKSLGISVIYINPIFEAASNHRYDTADYDKIDPILGTNQDFEALCEKALSMGIRIILDGVFSHTGADSIYFNLNGRYQSIGAYQSDLSPYHGWYRFSEFPRRYAAWWGFESLPETNERNADFRDFILRNDDAVIKRWIERGASGWRLDVADELPDEFIALLRTELKDFYSEALVLGEVWEDASTKYSMDTQRQFAFGKELDSVMNYPLRQLVLDFMMNHIDAERFRELTMQLWENYPRPFWGAALNLLSSHDESRVLSVLSGAPNAKKLSREDQAIVEYEPEEIELGKQRLKAAVLMQMTLPGVPCVYYGDEIGMMGLRDPFNRAPFAWDDMNAEILDWYKLCIGRRNGSKALTDGDFAIMAPHRDCLAILRYNPEPSEGMYVAIINRNAQLAQTITLNFHQGCEGKTDFLNDFEGTGFIELGNQAFYPYNNISLTLTVGPLSAIMLQSVNR